MNDMAKSSSDVLELPWDRLADYLVGQGLELDRTIPPERCSGGLANLNYKVWINGAPAILRRAPSGPIPRGAHDMAREHRVLSRLSGVFELAPQSFLLCEDPTVFGAPFQVIEFREGRVFRGDDISAVLPDDNLASSLAPMLADVMRRLHQIDPKSCDLENLGRPEGFVERNFDRWSGIVNAMSAGKPHEKLAAQVTTLVARKGAGYRAGDVGLLHCDIKLDNLMVSENHLSPVALLDWDMTTLGDPIYDLATLLSYWTEPGDPEVMQRLRQMPTGHAGFQSRADMAEAYAKATGRSLDHLPAVRALCQLKLAAVFLQLHARWQQGALDGEKYAEFENLGVSLLEYAHDVALGNDL